MELFRDIASVRKDKDSVLTVGTFDGVHRGHQFILAELKRRAQKCGCRSTVVTFDPHPQLVLRLAERERIRILTTIDEKTQLLEENGVDRAVVIEFTQEFAGVAAPDFVERILFDRVGFTEFVIGYDHAFGKNREGSIKTLRILAPELGFDLDELPAYKASSGDVSSTIIRKLLVAGEISQANNLLGRNYSITGEVVHGDGRGRELSFPTANLKPASANKLIPGSGVYAVYTYLGSTRYKGMMNIGFRPTFNTHTDQTVEVHLLNFDQSIYGEMVRIEFVDKIRDEKKFAGPGELVHQLNQDKAVSESIL